MAPGAKLVVDFKLLETEERKQKEIEQKRKMAELYAVEKVNNIMGSNAGAGSGDFHMYRNSRRIELERLDRIERDAKEQDKQTDFEHERLERAKREADRTAQRAAKRHKKKARKGKAEAGSGGGGDDDGDDGSAEEKDIASIKMRPAPASTAPRAG